MTFQVDKQCNIVRSRASGTLTIDDLVGYLTASRQDPDYEPTMNRVMDLREVTSLPTSDEVRELATFVRTRASADAARMAIIASSDLTFGVSMMFKAFVGYGDRLLVVRNEEDAAGWVSDGTGPE